MKLLTFASVTAIVLVSTAVIAKGPVFRRSRVSEGARRILES